LIPARIGEYIPTETIGRERHIRPKVLTPASAEIASPRVLRVECPCEGNVGDVLSVEVVDRDDPIPVDDVQIDRS